MENYFKEIEKKLEAKINFEKLEIIDNSHKHKGHKFFSEEKYHLHLKIRSLFSIPLGPYIIGTTSPPKLISSLILIIFFLFNDEDKGNLSFKSLSDISFPGNLLSIISSL